MKRLIKNLNAIILGCLIAFTITEITLRIYNPLPSRVKGNKIQLVSNLKRNFVITPPIIGLDKEFNYSTNSIGFRGVEPPEQLSEYLSIFTVGGSTTECSHLDDEKTWPQFLYYKLKEKYKDIWLNNAGIDGCSSFGHLVLLEDYLIKYKPDIILFLIGINDIGQLNAEEDMSFLTIKQKSIFMALAHKSETINILNTLYRNNIAKRYIFPHKITSVPDSTTSIFNDIPKEKWAETISWNKSFVPKYKSRVELLVESCIKNDIIPVLITQPLLDGYTTFGWEVMQLYNNCTVEVAKEKNVPLIDLANLLDKKSIYFYDSMHYTEKGANKVSEIIFEKLNTYLKDNFSKIGAK